MCVSIKEVFIFFFFQAEDGIRDLTVTGVQTCALPILQSRETLRCTWQLTHQPILSVATWYTCGIVRTSPWQVMQPSVPSTLIWRWCGKCTKPGTSWIRIHSGGFLPNHAACTFRTSAASAARAVES